MTAPRVFYIFSPVGLRDNYWELIWFFELDICYNNTIFTLIYGALRDLVPFVQYKKREKHPWRMVNFSKITKTLLKLTLLHGCFSRFLNCTNGTKSRNAPHIFLS